MTGDAILVTGGAGYIGSHTVLALRDAGRSVVVVDNFSTGNEKLVPPDVPIARGDVGDAAFIADVLSAHDVGAVLHFAASIDVSESVSAPLDYYRNNTAASLTLIAACVAGGVERFVFSSSAAVYGVPDIIPAPEDGPTRPINPYGSSKLMTEQMLADAAAAHGLRYAALRYFNVAGADPDGRSGECGGHAGHLLKVAAEAAIGRRPYVEIYGVDYDTPDGTCIRDFVHVSDLAAAHLTVLDWLSQGKGNLIVNCGYGHGFSVREVLSAVELEIGHTLDIRAAARRPGDSQALVADSTRIRGLGWQPAHDDLGAIVHSMVAWERQLAEGQ
jgi:UDP-glucose 4-epimerase